MDKLSKKIINEIEKEQIRPIPKSKFQVKNLVIWLLALISIFVGTLSIALVSYNVTARDWDLYRHLGDTPFGYLLSSLPYLWIGLTIISLIVGILNLEHTKKGYKYSPLFITMLSLVITLILGLSIFATGGGRYIDEYIGQKLNDYRTVEDFKEELWNQPAKGLFSGTISNVSTSTFELKDFSGKAWQVDYSEAHIRGNVRVEPGENVKVIGTAEDDTIKASDIRPWGFNGRGHRGVQR